MPTISGTSSTANSQLAALVQSYLTLERQPLDRLETNRTTLTSRLTAFNDLKGMLREVKSVVEPFSWPGSLTPLSAFGATSSDATVLTAQAGSGAAPGSHTITVSALAQTHSIGSLRQSGQADGPAGGDYEFAVTVGEQSTSVAVSLEDGLSWRAALEAVAAALESSGAPVEAAVVTPDAVNDEVQLLVVSHQSGTPGILAEVADTSGDLAAQLGLSGVSTPDAFAANTIQAAANATFTVDGLDFVAPGNQVEGALPGVTLTLQDVSTGNVTLTIARDIESVRTSVEAFLTAYNDLVDFVRTQTQGADENGENRGPLTGNSIFMGLRSSLRTGASDPVASLGGTGQIDRLAAIGITADREGHLTISAPDTFGEALQTNADEVDQLFRAEEDGVAVRLLELVDRHADVDGLIAQETDALQSRQRLLDRQITQLEARLAQREKQLTAQLASLQAAYNTLIEQQNSLTQLLGG